jgi:hypothetical protein
MLTSGVVPVGEAPTVEPVELAVTPELISRVESISFAGTIRRNYWPGVLAGNAVSRELLLALSLCPVR